MTRAVALGLLLVLALAGCQSTPSDGRPPDLRPLPATMTLLVARLEASPPTASDRAFGFDLDHQVDGTPGRCDDAMDFRSATTGEPGVDNQFGPVGTALFDMTYQNADRIDFQDALDRSLADGTWLLALRLTGIDDAWTDGDVLVEVHRAASSAALAVEADGALAPGATLTSTRLETTAHAYIQQGVLHVGLSALDVTLGHLYPEAHLTGVRLGGEITPEGLPDAAIGGAISMDDVVTIASATGGLSLSRSELESLLHPDLAPNASGSTCDAVSVGIGMRGVLATLGP